MSHKKEFVVSVVAFIVVVGLIYVFSHRSTQLSGAVDCTNGSTTCVNGNFGVQGFLSVDGITTLTGALTTTSGALSFNGVNVVYAKTTSFTGATTTPCVVQSPAATSTIRFYSYKITTGTSTAAVVDVGTSTTPYATSTINLIQQRSIASGAQDYTFYVGTSSSPTNVSNDILAPSTYVVLKTGAGLGGYTYTGVCEARFEY